MEKSKELERMMIFCLATGLDDMCEANIANCKLKFDSLKAPQLRKFTLFKSNSPNKELEALKKMNCSK